MQTENPYEAPQGDDREEMGFMSPSEKVTMIFIWVLELLFLSVIVYVVAYLSL
jgi:hypothetical protein